MKKSGKCPKCGNSDIALETKLHTWMSEGLGVKRGPIGGGAKFLAYICKNCGYSELYIHEKDLNKLK